MNMNLIYGLLQRDKRVVRCVFAMFRVVLFIKIRIKTEYIVSALSSRHYLTLKKIRNRF